MSAAPLSPRPFVTRAADARTIKLSPTNRFSFPLSGHDGHPELYLELAGRGDGPPLHRHPWPTWEVVLEGQVRFRIDDEDHLLGPGDTIYTPPNTAHAYTVESETARVVGLNPAGSKLEQLQRGAEPLFAGGGPPDMAAVMKLAKSVEVEVLGPPLAARR